MHLAHCDRGKRRVFWQTKARIARNASRHTITETRDQPGHDLAKGPVPTHFGLIPEFEIEFALALFFGVLLA